MATSRDGAPLTGYTNRLSARPGEIIEFKISSVQPYQANLVKIRCGDPNPVGPGIQYETVVLNDDGEGCFDACYPTQVQSTNLGSYAITTDTCTLPIASQGLTIEMDIWPTKTSMLNQTLFAFICENGVHICLYKAPSNCLVLSIGDDENNYHQVVSTDEPLFDRVWYHVNAVIQPASSTSSPIKMSVSQQIIHPAFDVQPHYSNAEEIVQIGAMPENYGLLLDEASGVVIIGADSRSQCGAVCRNHFNGKIADPTVSTAATDDEENMCLLLHFDFSQNMTTQVVQEQCHHLKTHLVNMPTRGVKGPLWDGQEMSWKHKPEHYNAIHFHEDDLLDCGWATSFVFQVPTTMPSGVYGARLETTDDTKSVDIIPFYILPPAHDSNNKSQNSKKALFLLPTFTYQIYANHVRNNTTQEYWNRVHDSPGAAKLHPDDYFHAYGASTYNRHSDQSGICYTSFSRPMLTFRPGFITFPDGGLRHFAADTHILDWLAQHDIDFDVITDHDLHNEGIDLLTSYRVVLTGSHPEYQTTETMNALEEYTNSKGGRFMYLGGNGFYWKIAVSPDHPQALEIRRGEGGIRAWSSDPGEYYNSFDGSYGGLWRRNGRFPQALAAVGFSSQGMFVGSYYRRRKLHDVEHEKVGWVFEGVTNEILGDYGLSGGGAAGFELDRADFRLGTPLNTILLASSENHGDTFIPVYEELLTHYSTESGEPKDQLVRADMVLCPKANGGCVFAVGSITYCGSLSHNGYDNDIARITTNVLLRFLSGTEILDAK